MDCRSLRLATSDLPDQANQFEHAGLNSAADVDHFLINAVGCGGGDHGIDDVIDIDVVAGLFAAAVDDDRAVGERLLEVAGDDRGVRRGNALTWPVGIKYAQTNRLNPVLMANRPDIMLGGKLRDGIWGTRFDRERFLIGDLGLVSVDRAR